MGASGGIGRALTREVAKSGAPSSIFALSRSNELIKGPSASWLPIDFEDEQSIASAAKTIQDEVGCLHLVFVATGFLHDVDGLQPEKSLKNLTETSLLQSFRVNCIGPGLVAKHFVPLLDRNRKAAFAALSARVGSISDNQLGGWHSYRTAKAALNMLLKTISIELRRQNTNALCVALHPGTVDTALSKPFQRAVPKEKLFSTDRAARQLLAVLNDLTAEDNGGFFAWDGAPIPF
ncbi:MAG: SDR family NAD(P)-dependent oxidoreductase [Pseudomonadota bacterium]